MNKKVKAKKLRANQILLSVYMTALKLKKRNN